MLFSVAVFTLPVDARAAAYDREPDPQCVRAWERFKGEQPGAEIRWGAKLGHPMIVWGFEPVESYGDFVGTLRDFLADNDALFGLRGGPTPGLVRAALSEPNAVYHCDHSRMEPLPGLREDEWIEPTCPEGTIVSLRQFVADVPYVNGEVLGFFDGEGRLRKVSGEALGYIEDPPAVFITPEAARLAVLDVVNALPDQVAFRGTTLAYRFILGEVLPTYAVRVALPFSFDELGNDLTFIVSAESATVLSYSSNIDGAPGDDYDEIVYGYTLDTQAAIECNEPAFRPRWVDTTYGFGNSRAAFNPDVHVYDMNEEDSCEIDRLLSNDTYWSYESFNYKFAKSLFCLPYNDDGNRIELNGISTWTAYHHILHALNYFKNTLGFDEDVYPVVPGILYHRTKYPEDHNLVVIVNKDHTDVSFCGAGHPSCFREYGFPVNDKICATNNQGFFTFYSIDEADYLNTIDPYLVPTMVLGTTSNYNPGPPASGTIYYVENEYRGLFRHPAMYHEFTHYVQKAFKTGNEYWENGSVFNVDETSAFKEGFAMYFGASMEEAGPDNFYLTNLSCESDAALFLYQPVFKCCFPVYDEGKVLTQILWDIRNGYSGSTYAGLGKLYTDQLAYLTLMEIALSDIRVMTFLWDTASSIVLNELADDCPVGSSQNCHDYIKAVFERHGVLTGIGQPYPTWDCVPESSCHVAGYCADCAGVVCPESAWTGIAGEGACHGAVKANCPVSPLTPICCGDGGTGFDNVCADKASTLVGSCGWFASEAGCLNDCTQNLWSQTFREYLRSLTAGDCKNCGDVCDAIPWAECGLFSYRYQCTWSCQLFWDFDKIRCMLENLDYPGACDACN
ncbi:MAG: hypothetical protein P9L99_14525 [Candidatus Lernaella stagnicola]|nr:hypothetical protein [Candidatus Lernaella stagnicola]